MRFSCKPIAGPLAILSVLVALGAVDLAPGQSLKIGSLAPKLDVDTWLTGAPVSVTGPPRGKLVVVEFWHTSCMACRRSLPQLTKLQRQFSGEVRVVGITSESGSRDRRRLARFLRRWKDEIGFPMGLDRGGATFKSYLEASGRSEIPTVFVIDKSGRIAWIGQPSAVLDRVVEELRRGKYDTKRAARVADLEFRLQKAVAAKDGGTALEIGEQILELEPGHLRALALRFTLNLGSEKRAKETLRQLLVGLRGNPDALVEFAHSDWLYGSERDRRWLPPVIDALELAVDANRRHVGLRTVLFRALARTEHMKKAKKQASELIRLVRGRPVLIHNFGALLSSALYREEYSKLALRALDLAIEADSDEPDNYRRKFVLLLRSRNDVVGARRVGSKVVQKAGGDASYLNEFAWYLLTSKLTKGRFNRLALAAAERMRGLEGGDNWMFVDTLALAKFENGLAKEAVALQVRAIDSCDNPSFMTELRQRLKRYQDALR